MPTCTPSDSWLLILTSLSPALAALLSATALWVAARARTTSRDAQSISQAVGHRSGLLPERRKSSGSPPGARERRKW